ncbi:MAG: toll/interleukin-1 receptor domain-containing protein [Planctomycetota bacterium]
MFGRKPQGKIFINYRRDDSLGVAGRLDDTLGEYFGEERVFRDTGDIEVGADFANVLDETVGSADAVIVLIGSKWLSATDESGQKRLHDPNDWVAREIASALEKQLPVFPVLIEGTPMPRAEDLPESLKPLVRYNAASISDSRWNSDVTRLAKAVAFDIPGSEAERKLDRVRLLNSMMLLGVITFTTGVVAWNALRGNAPLAYWQSGVSFVAIIASSINLLVFAQYADPSKRHLIQWGGMVGLIGSFLFYCLILPLDDAAEPIVMFFGSTVLATIVLVFMNLSGFKPK